MQEHGNYFNSMLSVTCSTIRSAGSLSELSALDSWNADIAAEEWVMVTASEMVRSLYVAKESDDEATDSYRALDDLMTVPGLGRSGVSAELTEAGEVFFVGLIETHDFDVGGSRIRSTL